MTFEVCFDILRFVEVSQRRRGPTPLAMTNGETAGGKPSSEESANTANNIISKGICSACNSDNLDANVVGIQCWWCRLFFHAFDCIPDCNVTSKSAFQNHIHAAVTKSGPYDRKFGRILFVCNQCLTEKEHERAKSDSNRIELLEKKLENVQAVVKEEISELKSLLKEQLLNSSSEQSLTSSSTTSLDISSVSTTNVWQDTTKINSLKQMLVIKSGDPEKSVPPNVLEKICVDNRIAVHKTKTFDKSNDTGVLVNSRKDADLLMDKLGIEVPGVTVEMKSTMKPTVSVVGLARKYEHSELLEMLKNQNVGISSLFSDPNTEPDDKFVDIINVSEIRAYKGKSVKLYKAIIRISNLIRSIIARQGDRVFLGAGTHKVYDSFYVLRCYNCQQFGHHSSQCTNNKVCGFCSGGHQTIDCNLKNNNQSAPTCINCKLESNSDCIHEAGSFDCPILKRKQKELMKKIPFYQTISWENLQTQQQTKLVAGRTV